jgi:multicomponent Na+:H+ antiporter subunit G
MMAYLTAFLLLAGSLFMLLAGVGVLRMPDVLTRMQAASKAATLGISCMFLALAAHFQEIGVASRAVLVIGFVFLTAPVAAHMLGRSAMTLGVPLWPGTQREDLEAGYGGRPEPEGAEGPEDSTDR